MSARLPIIDELCPPDVGTINIGLSLDSVDQVVTANVPFQINVDTSSVGQAGVSLPLELVVQGSIAGQRTRRVFSKSIPASLLLTVTSGGRYFILLRELFHNRYQGQLFVDVLGDDTKLQETR